MTNMFVKTKYLYYFKVIGGHPRSNGVNIGVWT